jgi:hypothetical protein
LECPRNRQPASRSGPSKSNAQWCSFWAISIDSWLERDLLLRK